MSERRSYLEAAQRQQPKETNPPPPYHEAVNAATPSCADDGLLAPRLPSHQNGYSSQDTPFTRAFWIDLRTAQSILKALPHERDISIPRREIQQKRAARKSLDFFRASAELRTHFGTIRRMNERVEAFKRHKITKEQREIKPSKNETSGIQWKTIGILRQRVASRDKMIERMDRTIQRRNRMIERRDRTILQKKDSVQSMSARLAAAEAALGEEEQEATYLGKIGAWAFSLAESVFRVAQMALVSWRPRVETFTGPYWLHPWIWRPARRDSQQREG